MNYKCPFCLYTFTEAATEEVEPGIRFYHCPNPAEIESGNARKKCGRRLPLNFMDSQSIVIALTGGNGVGKTYYFLALLDQLLHNSALHRIGIQGDILGSDADKKDMHAMYNQIRDGRRLIPTTLIEKALRSVIDLSITKKGRTRHVYLSFFDNPGERFRDIDYMIDKMANIYKADALLFLFEPKQIEKLWRIIIKNNSYVRQEDEGDSIYTVLNNTIQLIKQVNASQQLQGPAFRSPSFGFSTRWEEAKKKYMRSSNWRMGKNKIKTPIALAISKFDQLRKAIHVDIPFDESELELMCIREDGFDMDMVNRISGEIEDLICGLPDGETRIKQLLNADVQDYAFFGVKSIDVDEKGEPITLNPQGVLLPLIWLLAQLGLY